MFKESVNIRELIIDALSEAKIMEMARDNPDNDHMLYVAQRLSGAPFSFVRDVYERRI